MCVYDRHLNYSEQPIPPHAKQVSNYVLGTRNIFQLKSAKQEREAKFGTRECESWYVKKKL